jgi:hypothetical protein
MIMAIAIALWAAVRIERRYIAMVAALVIMALIRPHVGAISVIGMVTALLVTRQVRFTGQAPPGSGDRGGNRRHRSDGACQVPVKHGPGIAFVLL